MSALFVLIVAAFAPIIFPSNALAIYGGSVVGRDDPIGRQIVLLRVKKRDRYSVCTGIVYSKDVIVTAAHCFLIRDAHRKMPFTERLAIQRAAPQVRAADVKVFYRHAATWVQPTELRLDRDADVATMVMRSPHPPGYELGVIDERRSGEIAAELRDATFVYVGHDKVGLHSPGQVLRLDRRPTVLGVGTIGGIFMESDGNAGTCYGDSGSPVFIQDANHGMKLIGMLQGGVHFAAKFTIPGTDGTCSRVAWFKPMAEVRDIVQKLMAGPNRRDR
jgi:hypothetical protein